MTSKIKTPQGDSPIALLHKWEQLANTGFSLDNLYVKHAPGKGLGVFARRAIEADEYIEFCHCITCDTPRKYLAEPQISRYAYGNEDIAMILTGFGSIYNSADSPKGANAQYVVFAQNKLVVFWAQRPIEQHEEICVYHGEGFFQSWCKPSQPMVSMTV